MIQIEQISEDIAEDLCRKITADLPDYFGIPETNEHYFVGMRSNHNFAAKLGGDYIGLISLDFPYPNNCNIYWMAILQEHQGKGVGHKLIERACKYARKIGATTITVETLAPSQSDENYLRTYDFYQAVGFTPLIDLKPKDCEWNMVYMIKNIESINPTQSDSSISIRRFVGSDIPVIVTAFQQANWPKPQSTFDKYLKEQEEGARLIWVAYYNDQFTGYITLQLQSQYEPFRKAGIPEIMDLNVVPPFRSHGIGSELLETAENEALKKSDIVGIGVGLYEAYGTAQKLYIANGYTPDGLGITYNYEPVEQGSSVMLDDDLVLWFTKWLR